MLEELISLRDQLAKKLGFESYAALDIDDSMVNKLSFFFLILININKFY